VSFLLCNSSLPLISPNHFQQLKPREGKNEEIEEEENNNKSSVYTPAMKQYLEVKEKHPDFLLLFQIGDFYEMYFDGNYLNANSKVNRFH
jgi:hypothetical protein